MTFAMLLRTVFEILMFAFVAWGIFHEDRLAAFEKRILCNIKRKKILLCVIPTTEYTRLKEIIKELDKNAFFLITDSYSVSKQ